MSSPPGLADRYGAPSPVRRRLLVGAVAVVAALFVGWLAWAAWFHATPAVSSELTGWSVQSDHEARATVTVSLEEGVAATCVVRAIAEDHTTVGELAFEPDEGSNEVAVRTERRATSVDLVGCTAEGQQRPR
jgi:hypothetical protein